MARVCETCARPVLLDGRNLYDRTQMQCIRIHVLWSRALNVLRMRIAPYPPTPLDARGHLVTVWTLWRSSGSLPRGHATVSVFSRGYFTPKNAQVPVNAPLHLPPALRSKEATSKRLVRASVRSAGR